MTVVDAKNKIENALDRDGPYSHNIISLTLMAVAKEHGQDAANALIEEFDLESLGWSKV